MQREDSSKIEVSTWASPRSMFDVSFLARCSSVLARELMYSLYMVFVVKQRENFVGNEYWFWINDFYRDHLMLWRSLVDSHRLKSFVCDTSLENWFTNRPELQFSTKFNTRPFSADFVRAKKNVMSLEARTLRWKKWHEFCSLESISLLYSKKIDAFYTADVVYSFFGRKHVFTKSMFFRIIF